MSRFVGYAADLAAGVGVGLLPLATVILVLPDDLEEVGPSRWERPSAVDEGKLPTLGGDSE